MRKTVIVVMFAVGALLLAGCGKEVDKRAVDAELVHGTNNLYRFCDAIGTLIYFEDISMGDDQYEAMFFGACENGKAKDKVEGMNGNNGGANG